MQEVMCAPCARALDNNAFPCVHRRIGKMAGHMNITPFHTAAVTGVSLHPMLVGGKMVQSSNGMVDQGTAQQPLMMSPRKGAYLKGAYHLPMFSDQPIDRGFLRHRPLRHRHRPQQRRRRCQGRVRLLVLHPLRSPCRLPQQVRRPARRPQGRVRQGADHGAGQAAAHGSERGGGHGRQGAAPGRDRRTEAGGHERGQALPLRAALQAQVRECASWRHAHHHPLAHSRTHPHTPPARALAGASLAASRPGTSRSPWPPTSCSRPSSRATAWCSSRRPTRPSPPSCCPSSSTKRCRRAWSTS
jgi:hypothetical protein